MTQTIQNSFPKLLVLAAMVAAVMLTGGAGCSDSDNGVGNGTEPDSISFASNVQPILNANCADDGCHIEGPEPRTNRSLKDYESVMEEALGRLIVVPFNAEKSEIIKRLEGTSTPQMPFGKAPLRQTQIDLIARWIDEGALNN